MALAREPKLLLLDEPTAGMSPQERRATGDLLAPIKERCSLLIVEHDLDFIKDICDTLTVLDQGQVVDSGPTQIVQNSEKVKEAYLAMPDSRSAPLARSRRPVHLLRHQPGAVRRLAQGPFARRRGHPRAQRRRQDHAAEDAGGRPEAGARQHPLRQCRCHAAAHRAARAQGHRLRAAGARRVREADGQGESAGRRDGDAQGRSRASTKCWRCFRSSASAWRSRRARCPAASARCWPSAARCWRGRTC